MSQAALYWCCYYGLEATFLSFLLLNPGYPGFGAFPRRRPLHGLSYPWVSGSSAVVTLPLCCSILATPSWAAPYLGDALLGRRLTLATLYVDFDLDFVNARVRDGTPCIGGLEALFRWLTFVFLTLFGFSHCSILFHCLRGFLDFFVCSVAASLSAVASAAATVIGAPVTLHQRWLHTRLMML